MNLTYTYWNAKEGGYIGFINQFPDYWTQGDSIEELESMLSSLYDDIIQFDDIQWEIKNILAAKIIKRLS